MPTMHRRIALITTCLLLSAGTLAAQSPLPESIPTSASLSDNDRSALVQLIEESRPGLSGTSEQIKRSRNALIAPLRVRGITGTFRVEYSRLVVPVVQPLAKSEKEEVAINAVRIAGEVATRQALDVLDEAIKDSRPGVRMMAALGYVRAFGTAREGATPLIPAQVRPTIDLIAARLQAEKDPRVLEALVMALDSAIKVPDASIKDAAGWAMDALAAGTGKLAQSATPDVEPALMKATKALFDAISGGTLRVSPAALKEAGASAGDVVAAVVRRSAAEPSDEERAMLAALADQSANVYYFAAQNLRGKPTQYKLGEAIRSSDDAALKRDAAAMFVSLTAQPFGVDKSRYAQ